LAQDFSTKNAKPAQQDFANTDYIHNITTRLRELLPEKRFNHSLGVQEEAVRLAKHWGADIDKASLAGLTHDCCKNLTVEEGRALAKQYNLTLDEITMNTKGLLHAPLGAEYAKREFGIDDNEVLDAIRSHTTGRSDMTLLEKIIYIADYIEPTRKNFTWLEPMRALAYKNLDKAVLYGLNIAITYIIDKNEPLNLITLEARNYYLTEENKCH
jgi:predicted HD superfamily hydrolase involved in NAD metabolism